MKCFNCGEEIKDDAKYCDSCRAIQNKRRLNKPKVSNENNMLGKIELNNNEGIDCNVNEYCKICGKQIESDSVFCKYCGTQLINKTNNSHSNKEISRSHLSAYKKNNGGKIFVVFLGMILFGFYLIVSEMNYQDAVNKYEACVVGNHQRIRNSNSDGFYFNVHTCEIPNRIDYYRLW